MSNGTILYDGREYEPDGVEWGSRDWYHEGQEILGGFGLELKWDTFWFQLNRGVYLEPDAKPLYIRGWMLSGGSCGQAKEVFDIVWRDNEVLYSYIGEQQFWRKKKLCTRPIRFDLYIEYPYEEVSFDDNEECVICCRPIRDGAGYCPRCEAIDDELNREKGEIDRVKELISELKKEIKECRQRYTQQASLGLSSRPRSLICARAE